MMGNIQKSPKTQKCPKALKVWQTLPNMSGPLEAQKQPDMVIYMLENNTHGMRRCCLAGWAFAAVDWRLALRSVG